MAESICDATLKCKYFIPFPKNAISYVNVVYRERIQR